jgi:hypothetical protein
VAPQLPLSLTTRLLFVRKTTGCIVVVYLDRFSELEIKVSNRLEKRSTQNNLRTEVGLHFKRHAGSSPSGGPSADQRPTLPGYPLRCRGPCRHTIGCRTSANDVQTLQAILSSFVVLRPLPQWNAV